MAGNGEQVRRAAWRSAVEGVLGWRPGSDPEPVLEALGLALVLDLTGDLVDAPGLARVRARGREALLAADFDEDDAVWAASVARAGLSVLEHRPLLAGVGDAIHPPPGRLLDMLRGRPDGISAGACAAHVHRCVECAGTIRAIELAAGGAEEAGPLMVAAESAAPMRDPTAGRVLHRVAAPAVELVLFETPAPPRLAAYSSESAPVRLEADRVVTEHMLSGYWLGRLTPETTRVKGVLHVGDATVEIDLDVG